MMQVYEHEQVYLRFLVEMDPVIEVDLGLHVFGNRVNFLRREAGYVVVLGRVVWGRKKRWHGVHRRDKELIELVIW